MSQTRCHVIRRECIDLAVEGGESEGFALQGQLAALCQGELATALDQALSRVVPDDEHWLIERIEVDAGNFTLEGFTRDFVAAVAASVEEEVRVRKAATVTQPASGVEEGDVRRSDVQSSHAALLHFLATGALPWWCHLPAGQTLEAVVSESWSDAGGKWVSADATTRAALLRTLASPVARLRLARQFSGSFVGSLLEGLAPGAFAVLCEVVLVVRRELSVDVSDGLPEHAWAAVFTCLAAHQAITPRHLLDAWAALAPDLITLALREGIAGAAGTAHDGTAGSTRRAADAAAHESRSTATNQDRGRAIGRLPVDRTTATASIPASTPSIDLQEGTFVDCAGMVLLHPFLPRLFERLGVSAEDQLVQPDRALALLHFLATGQASAPEHVLLLPKLLCGLEPSGLAGAPVLLSESDRAEAESLLQAAIDYWPAIGQTSHDGFRGNFLVRPGKLSKRGDDDLLQVEKQGWDILLGQLPWSIGVVRLPWMQRFLWVEWPY